MPSSPKIGRDSVPSGPATSDNHATVLFSLPALDPTTAGMLTTKGTNSCLGVLAVQVCKATTIVAAETFGGVVGHWVGGCKVTTTIGGGGLVGLTVGCSEGSTTTALLRLVAGGCGYCYQTKEECCTTHLWNLIMNRVT